MFLSKFLPECYFCLRMFLCFLFITCPFVLPLSVASPWIPETHRWVSNNGVQWWTGGLETIVVVGNWLRFVYCVFTLWCQVLLFVSLFSGASPRRREAKVLVWLVCFLSMGLFVTLWIGERWFSALWSRILLDKSGLYFSLLYFSTCWVVLFLIFEVYPLALTMRLVMCNSHSQPKQMGVSSSKEGCSTKDKVALEGRIIGHTRQGGRATGGLVCVALGFHGGRGGARGGRTTGGENKGRVVPDDGAGVWGQNRQLGHASVAGRQSRSEIYHDLL